MNGRMLRVREQECRERMKTESAKPPVYPKWSFPAEPAVETMDFAEPDVITPVDSSPNYESMTYNEIVELAKLRGMSPGRSKKSVIIAELKKYDEVH